jgi:hypothetical protein
MALLPDGKTSTPDSICKYCEQTTQIALDCTAKFAPERVKMSLDGINPEILVRYLD